ncbi:MAG: MFS transporter [Syntrophobacteraceae bacterium]
MNRTAPQMGRILSLSSAHLLNDWYMNYIQTLLPFLLAAGLPVSKGAFLVSAFTITSSLIQPVTGYLVDQRNHRWLVYAGTLWMAVLLGLLGILSSYTVMVLIVTLAGLGTAAFHPQASAMITAVSGGRKGFCQAIFITFGNIGWALTPLTLIPFTQSFGLEMTPVFMLPGMGVALLLLLTAPKLSTDAARVLPPPLWESIRAAWKELGKVVTVVAFRSLTAFSLVAFLPLYLQHKDIPLIHGGRLLSLMLFSGAMGGLVGGHFSDLFGRKRVIVISLVLVSPLLYLFFSTTGPLSYILLVGVGAMLHASFSVTVVTAQELIPKNAAMASGLMLGFGIGIGGLGVGLMGLLVEYAGIERAIHTLIWLPFVAGIIGLSLKSRR